MTTIKISLKSLRQGVTDSPLRNLCEESQAGFVSPEKYNDLVDFFGYTTEFGELASLYDCEKERSNDCLFSAMRDWMPVSPTDIPHDRIHLLRCCPHIQFPSFRRAVVTDVDIPGRLLLIRPLCSQPRGIHTSCD